MRHPLAPKLPTSRYHIPAPNPEIAVQIDVAQVASPMTKESPSRPQRGPRLPQHDQTYHQNQDQDLDIPRSILPDVSERPVAGRALCRQTVDMFQHPGLATYLRSARQTCSRPCSFVALFCANYELPRCALNPQRINRRVRTRIVRIMHGCEARMCNSSRHSRK